MMKTSNLKISLLLIVLFLIPLSRVSAEEEKPVHVGALLSLSGGLEQWCNYIKQGIDLAASEEGNEVIKITYEDDRSIDLKSTVSAARKLIDHSKVDLLFSWSTAVVPVLVPLSKKNHLPLFIGGYDKRVANGGDYVFGGFINYLTTPRDIVNFFAAKGAKRLALVLANDFWSTSHEEPFRDEARLRGLEIVYSQTIDPKETETRAIIANLKRHKVDAVLAPLFGPSLVSFIRRHREARSDSLINVADGMFEEDIKSIGDAAEGVSATQIWLESAELSAKIKARFGDSANPLQLGLIATGYDAIKHLSALARDLRTKGIAINGESINTALKSFSSNGYLGRLMIAAPPARSGEEVVVVECLRTGEESGKGSCKYRR